MKIKSLLSQLKLKVMLEWSIRVSSSKLGRAWYQFRCLFHPYNVIKCQQLDRTWTDRDNLMLHAMFQILVDFVELEQPFNTWSRKHKTKRRLNRVEMREFIERHYNTEEARVEHCWEGATVEEREKSDKRLKQTYLRYLEILYLYEWYKDGKYEFDFFKYHNATGMAYRITNCSIEQVPTGAEIMLTNEEFFETENEHKLVCDLMLKRILNIRDYLWT
jgi:hypothetical protein